MRVTPDHLEHVAKVYLEACSDGRPPTLAVQEYFTTSRPTAGRWVMQARTAGLIPPTSPGRSSRENAHLLAIAEDLCVDVSDLRAAILRRRPNGDLRIRV